ncbi:MAG TPA: phenolic acid decarboxylase subunit B, partial [Mycobacterium sp.]|nr:phenolic acid decarboxylase subunit B [Mycobacterium sp.]
SVDEVTTHVVGRVIDQLGIQHSLIERWKDHQHPDNGDRWVSGAADWTTSIEDTSNRPQRTATL